MLNNKNIFTQFFFLLFIMSTLAVTTTGCNKKGCTDPLSTNYDPDAKEDNGTCVFPTVGQLGFMFHSKVGTQAFNFGQEYTQTNGRKFKFNVARFYISNLRLLKDGGGMVNVPDAYLQANAAFENYDIGIDIPEGHYDGVVFDVGVDDVANTSDPSSWAAGHALSSSSSTFDHWSWNSGYKFIRLEGMTDTTAAMTGAVNTEFVYHIGLGINRREVNIQHHFDVSYKSKAMVHMVIDWGQFLENVDLANELDTHTTNDSLLAATIANEAPAAISAM